MKFDIVEMISEFAGLNQSPNFKPVSTSPDSEGSGHHSHRRNSNASVKSYNAARRGSLNIPVGVTQLPQVEQKPEQAGRRGKRSGSCANVLEDDSVELKTFLKNVANMRRQSSPCVQLGGAKKLALKRAMTNDSCDFPSEKEEDDRPTSSEDLTNKEKPSTYLVKF
ncbi:hypothetical protein WR25_01769 [Diploscapter pachys]|uniref:Uncharacterized protein n=1 Tax=Diploscapter pachys TaxID=2018661 RepID=A0A2A2JIP3_9BILA|nr:hypothetical protein WR25_01769 [Diploscapter pachys]